MFNKLINIKIGSIRLSFLITKIQTVKGLCSSVIDEKDKHYILWEFDNSNLGEVITELRYLQDLYNLADIFITSDKKNSYHAFCFSKKTLKEYVIILLKTNGIEWNFIRWTIIRGKATLRTITKMNRNRLQIIKILEGYEPYKIPEKYLGVFYETGMEKIRCVNYG